VSDRRRSLELYRRAAPHYRTRWLLERLRGEAVAALRLRPGQVVVDVGCGAGSSFSRLQAGIGPEGRIIGLEQSPHMLERARHLVAARGWHNVTLVEAAAEDAVVPARADAALLMLVHDILRADDALAHVIRMLGPGGRVVAAGRKWAPWFLRPLDILAWRSCRRFQTTSEGLARPWDKLERLVPGLTVETPPPWNCFVASGTIRQA
jgi:ubiquinone/menaquinone biosynthesis C-methylase UbiE